MKRVKKRAKSRILRKTHRNYGGIVVSIVAAFAVLISLSIFISDFGVPHITQMPLPLPEGGINVSILNGGYSGLFNFFISPTAVSSTINMTNGRFKIIPLFYGNGTDFIGVGESANTKLAVSNNDKLLFNISNKDAFFIASWDSNVKAESYFIAPFIIGGKVSVYREISDVPGEQDSCVRYEDNFCIEHKDLGWVCENLNAGDNCAIGNVNLIIDGFSSDSNNQWIEFSINEGGSFDRAYDIDGNVLFLPDASFLPAKEYIVQTEKTTLFDGETTDPESVSGEMASDFIVEREEFGRIRFSAPVNITRIKANLTLLYDGVTITKNKVKVNTTILPEFAGVPAEVTLRNITFRNPQINYNGVLCPQEVCILFSYNINTKEVIMNVTSFSEFEIIEGPFCGDKICNRAEDCSSCAEDCGACTTPSSGTTAPSGSGDYCVPKWSCVWGDCINGYQTENCTKTTKYCNLDTGKPTPKTRACTAQSNTSSSSCTAEWSCVWGDCINGEQIKTCNKKNPECLDNSGMPESETRTCEISASEKNNFWLFVIVIAAAVIIAAALLIVFLLSKMKRKKSMPIINTPATDIPLKGDYISEEEVNDVAMKTISKLKNKNYSEREIRDAFKEKGWRDQDLDSLL